MPEFEKLQIRLKTAEFLLRQMLEKVNEIQSLEGEYLGNLNLDRKFKEKYINQLFKDYHELKELFSTQGNLMK